MADSIWQGAENGNHETRMARAKDQGISTQQEKVTIQQPTGGNRGNGEEPRQTNLKSQIRLPQFVCQSRDRKFAPTAGQTNGGRRIQSQRRIHSPLALLRMFGGQPDSTGLEKRERLARPILNQGKELKGGRYRNKQ
jgi:hypothetical protein